MFASKSPVAFGNQVLVPKPLTNQEKLEKFLQKNQKNKFSKGFSGITSSNNSRSNSKHRSISPKINTGLK